MRTTPPGRRATCGANERAFHATVVILCAVIALCVLYPLGFILVSSISDPVAVAMGKVYLWPVGFTLEGYLRIFAYAQVWVGYRNTLLYTVTGTALCLFFTLPAAYALSRKDLIGRGVFNGMFTLTMFFSGGLIPTYLIIRNLGLMNTLWALILPTAIGMYHCVIVRTYFIHSIPHEITEAAFIDGCSNLRLFLCIVLPLSKPVIGVLTLFSAVGHWNAYFSAMIYLRDAAKYPLQLILRNILVMGDMMDIVNADPEMIQDLIRLNQLKESMKYGLIVVSSLPVLTLYPFIQKYFVKGVMVGAIKG